MTFAPYEKHRSRETIEERFAKHVSPEKVAFYRNYDFAAIMGERHDVRFRDAFDGRTFFNCHSNGGVFNLGHRHPRVIDAVRSGLDHFDVGNHHLVSGVRADLAQALSASTANALDRIVFGVSGGEAIDLAIKVARGSTGRRTIISVHGGYHGHTGLALAAGDSAYREPFGPNLDGFEQILFDDSSALERAVDESTAAVIVEPVPATLGMPIAKDGYFARLSDICQQRGALVICDEVQTGLGRTGTKWCYEQLELSPDILVTGKGLSGGVYPITATLIKTSVHDSVFKADPFIHISTFGGAELGCLAALEVLALLDEPGFLEHVRSLATRFAEGFRGLPFELRQRGLMMGLKFPFDGGGLAATKALYDGGIFAVYANNDKSVLQFLPPLVTTLDQADEIIGIVKKTFS